MKALQRRSYKFDTRSVMLFAALSLGGVGALQAQTPSSSPQFGPAEKTAPQTGSKFTAGPSSTPAAQATTASAAFDRADTNKDGQLSAQEAAKLPAISQRFKQLDADQNGTLSRSEFEKGANS
ncbi:EF-hand domain-containing protein [Acidovorax sp. LjRoot129]|uniref:EF-hand domain-containing protein n=1 Tax=Acidovorax sp. LjRoot129 TaxID=3342260 RepID=UPI003ECD21E7